ncbi:hypothetical protein SNOG_08545 [Parastagonospora nodorum SN15]|uniref:Uncharacterized protein n=1 Tax=Phaeosphaeria nodorum (strain SN15 / ATCC MYA-4574 / FGSC 10173) TaxID=321614 RepID=Q0UI69_PHANO|nr:hypothetical protein SNOG_08545 [Parastagonospora nodorum SN15]EAT83713.1 hypothetical protein SNOG_08545 [Parastagonospora nodorum SN15]
MLQQDHQWEDHSTIGLRAAQTAGKLKMARFSARDTIITGTTRDLTSMATLAKTSSNKDARERIIWGEGGESLPRSNTTQTRPCHCDLALLDRRLLRFPHPRQAPPYHVARVDIPRGRIYWPLRTAPTRWIYYEQILLRRRGRMACAECMPLVHTDEYTRFCVSGHRMLETTLGGPLVFRGVQMDSARYAEMLRGEFGIDEEDEQSKGEEEQSGEDNPD